MKTRIGRQPWEHEGVRVVDGRLLVAGRDAEALAREHGTPLYVFDVVRVAEQARALRDALARARAHATRATRAQGAARA